MELMDAARATAIVDRAAHLDEMNKIARERVQRNAENSMSTPGRNACYCKVHIPHAGCGVLCWTDGLCCVLLWTDGRLG